ncbi:MAG: hypothetical protein JO092_03585 [Candidatus Eremiobacteraeota bacterium]|nr:hypothetical protein [Candidatus Eremiobacteraeota bacterium]
MKSPAWVIPATFLGASLICRLRLLRAPVSIATDLRQPIAVVTNWHAFGAMLFAIVFAACAIGTIAHLATVRSAPNIRFIVAACVVAIGCAWLMPVIFSSDVYAYAAYGELFRIGGDPYGHAALPSGNPIFEAAVWQWGNPPPTCVYGPAFVWFAAAIVTAAHSLTVAVTLDLLRLAASLALPLCALLAYAAYRGDEAARVAAAAIIGLNPVAIWCAVEGHNDALALAAVLGGFAFVRSGQAGAGGALAALSGALKFPGIVAGVPIAVAQPRARAGVAIGVLGTLLLSIPLLHGIATQLVPRGRYAPQASFEAVIKPLALLVFREDGTASIATWSIALLAAAAVAFTAIRLLRCGRREGWAQLAAGGWLLIPNPYPWYALWLLPVAAIAPRSKASIVLLVLTLLSLLRYVPDTIAAVTPLQEVLLGLTATIPLAALFAKRNGNDRTA